MVRMMVPTALLPLVALLLLAAPLAPLRAALAASVPVLLSFDTEVPADAAALRKLDVREPATYFFAGPFIESHPQLVRDLVEGNTVGAHTYSHGDLTRMEPETARADLLLSKLVLEQVTGTAPRWFRAPYLAIDESVSGTLAELGFRYDSSDQERWSSQARLFSVPVSGADGGDMVASDYELFERFGFSDERALDWLKARYRERVATGRPLMILMHPRIIGEHAGVLHGFIDFVHEQGGRFLTADQYVAEASAPRGERLGAWVDFSNGDHDPAKVAADAARLGLTDMFVMARDPEGNRYYRDTADPGAPTRDLFGETVTLLRDSGVRVHAWIPVNKDLEAAQLNPEWAMVGQNGARSTEWVSPSHPQVRARLLATVNHLLANYQLDGIHLDYLRYPSLDYDFSPHALASFTERSGLADVSTADLLTTQYMSWMDARISWINDIVDAVRAAARSASLRPVEVSAALIADAALNYRSMETYGQDYSALATRLDLVIPMAYFKEERRPVEWIPRIALAVRNRIGATPMLMGLGAYQKPGEWSLPWSQFEKSVEAARAGAGGIVIYPYLYLAGRGDPAQNLPVPGATEEARLALLATQLSGAGAAASKPAPATPAQQPPGPTADPVSSAVAGLALAGVALVIACVAFVLRARARRRRAAGPELLPVSPAALTDERGWQQLQAGMTGDTVAGEGCEQVTALLRGLGTQRLRRFRLAHVLETLENHAATWNALLGTERQQTPERVMLRLLEEALLLEFVETRGDRLSLTEAGRDELRRCRADGYSAELFGFVEQLLSEVLIVTCPHCGARNETHWFWHEHECGHCDRKVVLRECDTVARRERSMAAARSRSVLHALSA